ncbi:MAG: TMEM43 family protein [Rickettsiales bacterium]|jgi:hypothetical protein|nr:TMEM43 family protein [Rickettsiales bacterium]
MEKLLSSAKAVCLVVIGAVMSTFVAVWCGNMMKFISDDVEFVHDKIKNKVDYSDEDVDLTINDVFSLKKEVHTYQWVEERKSLNKSENFSYVYKKQWTEHPVNSDEFYDKTKVNFHPNNYKNKVIIPDKLVTAKHNYVLDHKHFLSKIQYKYHKFRANEVVLGTFLNKKYNFNYKNNDTKNFVDLDAYVSSIEKEVAEKEREKLKVVDEHILYNGENMDDPKIGDVKIVYKIFTPPSVSILENTKNKSIIVDFTGKSKNDLLFNYRVGLFFLLALYFNALFFVINKILLFLRGDFRDFSLRFIPYFNEYFVYSCNHKTNVTLVSLAFFLIVIKIYWLVPIPLLLLIIFRKFDYYSI